MAVKRRTIWLNDEDWLKANERAAAFSLNPSAYIAKLIEWRQPPTDGDEVVNPGVNPRKLTRKP